MTKIYINIKQDQDSKSLLEFGNNKIVINLNKETSSVIDILQDILIDIQCAAKKISSIINNIPELSGDSWNFERVWAFIKGFDSPKNTDKPDFSQINLKTKEQDSLNNLFDITKWCKNLINAPAQEIYPESLCNKISEYLTELAPNYITSETITAEKLLEHNFNGIYTVGKAGEKCPAINILNYNPNKNNDNKADIVLVGKGITFDSGGYSIKNNSGMLYMRKDMSGAATLAAALGLAIKNGLKKRVILITCSAENMVGPNAFKLGDIIKYKNGVSVEITNTDAEGRLVLADGLIKAQEYKPKLIIDAATLTGAAHIALGSDRSALFSYNNDLANIALKSSEKNNEKLWRLPLDQWHSKTLKSSFADIKNSEIAGGGKAGASIAAGFLSYFLGDYKNNWLHFDLSSAWGYPGSVFFNPGATADMVVTISDILQSNNFE